jgi:hypothetical protein
MIIGSKHAFKHLFNIQKERITRVPVNICYIDYRHNVWNGYSKRPALSFNHAKLYGIQT